MTKRLDDIYQNWLVKMESFYGEKNPVMADVVGAPKKRGRKKKSGWIERNEKQKALKEKYGE